MSTILTRHRESAPVGWARLVGLLFFLALPVLHAAPFAEKITFTQPDGTPLVLWGEGDEFSAVFETLDGYTVAFDPATKAYHYADLAPDGSALQPVGLPVGQANPVALGLAKHRRLSPAARQKQASARFALWDQAMRLSERWATLKTSARLAAAGTTPGWVASPPAYTTVGTKVGLCLLVDFSDATGTVAQAEIVNFCNGTNYTGFGNNGSVMKYFYDNSNGLLTYTNVVTAYLRVPQPKTYYNDTSKGCGTQGRLLITDALGVLTNLPNYTTEILPAFNDLTVNSSSNVVACNVFFAGANSGVWSYGLWPHSWVLASAVDLGNGKKVYPYQITNIGSSLALGTFCHENGHMLCAYPDIYDYGYDSYGGAGVFCLMDYGGSGGNPVQICAYLKRASGWATTTELNSNSIQLATVSAAGPNFNHFYRYAKPGTATEYFLVENRQQFGRDATLPASGIAVWHIDELGNRDNQSLATNTTHANYEVTLVQADNLWHFQNKINTGDANDLYYLGNSAAAYTGTLNDDSTPWARWWSGARSGLKFSLFSTIATSMTFFVGSPGINIVVAGTTLTAESCLPTNGVLDPGETVTLQFTLQNTGTVDTTNLVATLLATGGVTNPSAPQTYGALTTNGPAVSRPFTFTATGNCGSTLTAVLTLADGATNLAPVATTFTLGALNTIWTENFDTVTAPALPPGWTTTAGGSQLPWVTATGTADTAPNAAFSTAPSTVGSNTLDSPPIAIATATAQLTFRHNYNLETGYDGGVLEIKIGSGTFTDILTAGGSFVTGGYNGTISTDWGNPLAGRQAWTGASGGYLTTTVNLPASAAGQTIQLRWCCGTDNGVSGAGWYLDSITLNDRLCCTTVAPIITQQPQPTNVCPGATATFTVTATGTAPLTYQWQTNNVNLADGAHFTGATTTNLVVANIDATVLANYSCLVSNAAGTTPSTAAALTMTDTQPPTITCPGNLNVPAALGQCASNVTFTVTAADNCAVTNTTCAPPSGATFPAGTTPVTCTAWDSAGNTNTCAFTVTVHDTQSPQIMCPLDLTATTDPGQCSKSNVTFTVTAADNCAVTNLVCVPASGATFPRGVTTVTCTATDAEGHIAACNFNVTITDNQSPTLTCPANILATAADSNAVIITFAATAQDNCDSITPVCTPPSGSVFPTGTTNVTCRAVDAAGNTNICAFTVTVVDATTFRIISIVSQSNDVLLNWIMPRSVTGFVQTATGCDSTNFTDTSAPIFLPGTGTFPTNHLDPGAITNRPAWFYRIRLTP